MRTLADQHLITANVCAETYMVWAELPDLPVSAHIRAFTIQTWLVLYAYQGRSATA